MTAFNAPAYDIERPTGQCAFTGRRLEPGEAYMATLVEVDPPPPAPAEGAGAGKARGAGPAAPPSSAAGLGLRRLDVSMPAWSQGQRPQRLFGYWKSVVPQPDQKKRLFVDDEVLLNIFRRLGESDQPDRQAFRFVLGLILMRKKLLKYEGSERRPGPDGQPQEWWRLAPRGEHSPLEMLDPHLDDAKVQQVKDQLSEILQAEL